MIFVVAESVHKYIHGSSNCSRFGGKEELALVVLSSLLASGLTWSRPGARALASCISGSGARLKRLHCNVSLVLKK